MVIELVVSGIALAAGIVWAKTRKTSTITTAVKTIEAAVVIEVKAADKTVEQVIAKVIPATRGICSVCGRKVAKFIITADGALVCLLHKGI